MKKALLIFSTVIFILLLIITWVWYKERVLYLDSAYLAFNFINTEMPVVEHNRYAFYLLQVIPWAMLKTGFAIPIILRIFSIGHVLIALTAFIILIRIKQPKPAILLALFQVLTYRECFFLALNETSILIASCLLLSGFMYHFGKENINTIKSFSAYLTCIITAVFSHPMAMLLCPFVAFMYLANSGNIKSRQSLLLAIAFIISVSIKVLVSSSSAYENDLYVQLANTVDHLSNLKNLNSTYFFFGHFTASSYLFKIYFIPLSVFIFIVLQYFQKRNYKILVFYLAFITIFWLLIIVMFNRGDSNIFMEKNFTPWVFACIYPVACFSFRYIKLYSTIFIGIIIYSFWSLYKTSNIYTKRYSVLDNLLTANTAHYPKLIIQDSTIDHAVWQGTWALPYESLLLCKIKGIPNTTVKVYHNEEHINKELHRPEIFLGADFIQVFPAVDLLNGKYFKLEEKPYLPTRLDK